MRQEVTLQRSVNDALIKQRLFKTVAQQEKIIRKAADTLNISEQKVVEVIKGLKHKHLFNPLMSPDNMLQQILSEIANDDNTRDAVSEWERLRKNDGRRYKQINK